MQPGRQNPNRLAIELAGIFVLLALLTGLAGYLFLERRQASAHAEAHRTLAAIADLKLRQIVNWRDERYSDARFFSQARFVANDVRRFLEAPHSEPARAALMHWLALLKSGERYYAVKVYDTNLTERLALPAPVPPVSVPAAYPLLRQALQQRTVVFGDLLRDPANGLIHLDIAFPVQDVNDGHPGQPVAIFLLVLDARQFLFPLIQSWPVPTDTAETLLVRKDGPDVLFLNDLRHLAHTALKLRVPLSSPDLPAAKVLRGETNVLEGIDYRGQIVVATGRLIPETAWGLVAKMDREEVFAPLRMQTVMAWLALGALWLAAALLVALLWRQQNNLYLRQTKDQFAQANAVLETRVRERTAELEAANRELETFSYAVSHDLQAPLRTIRGFSQALLEDLAGKLTENDQQYLQQISAGCARMGELTEALLSLSRLARAPLRRQPVNLAHLTRQIVAELQNAEPNRVVTCKIAEEINVQGDPVLLRQVMANLLANAFKFTGKKAAALIEVGQQPPTAAGAAPVCFVRDNGVGFDLKYADKLFAPFQRLHPRTEFPGTGIGLSTVQRIIHRHGGRLWVEAQPDLGATFYFTIPPDPTPLNTIPEPR